MMNNINKLILGTVQFGLKYGINNSVGQVILLLVMEILKNVLVVIIIIQKNYFIL